MEETIISSIHLSDVHEGLSVLDLFLSADWIVKSVMIGLALTSIWCWQIIISKHRLFSRLFQRANRFESLFWAQDTSIEDLYERLRHNPRDPLSLAFIAGMEEWHLLGRGNYTIPPLTSNDIVGRIKQTMYISLEKNIITLEKYIPVLATTASSAPFIGLFGTVWGIMNSFTAIAAAKQTNLAVVAPGIAEALFATAIGLIAAIPASIAYNKLAKDLSQYHGRVEAFISEFSAYIAREIDKG
ncbi:MAG: protein TolQ [Pseudomonadota bacterium]